MTTANLLQTIELHALQRDYAHLRWRAPNAVARMAMHLKTFGQLQPVIVIPTGPQRWLLVDGYKRLLASEILAQDTILAEIWPCTRATALMRSLLQGCSRNYHSIEEANILRELKEQHQMSQAELARQLGRDISWVSRRLALVEQLPEFVSKALLQEIITTWSASRIMAPLARANTQHAKIIIDYAEANPLSTRELHDFYLHYAKSNPQIRNNICDKPGLFFLAQREVKKNDVNEIDPDPEKSILKKIQSVKWQLKSLVESVPGQLHTQSLLKIALLASVDEIILHASHLKQITQEIFNA
jgi:ParB/RepB/Spo0J family partition protein